jgi:SnoaL-like polyketide cyclase
MSPHFSELRDFRSALAAWCSQNPESVAAFFSKDGSLRVNDDPPAVGRHAISEVARSFMTAFPDLMVVMDDLVVRTDGAEYHWTLTGTNSGPCGSGRTVRISGLEKWRIGLDRLIASSQGHFDAAGFCGLKIRQSKDRFGSTDLPLATRFVLHDPWPPIATGL